MFAFVYLHLFALKNVCYIVLSSNDIFHVWCVTGVVQTQTQRLNEQLQVLLTGNGHKDRTGALQEV